MHYFPFWSFCCFFLFQFNENRIACCLLNKSLALINWQTTSNGCTKKERSQFHRKMSVNGVKWRKKHTMLTAFHCGVKADSLGNIRILGWLQRTTIEPIQDVLNRKYLPSKGYKDKQESAARLMRLKPTEPFMEIFHLNDSFGCAMDRLFV